MLNNVFRKSCLLLDKVEEYGGAREARDDNTKQRMRFAFWITDTHIHSEFIILIAFPRQPWLRTRALMFRYTYIHGPSCLKQLSLAEIK